MTLANKLQRVLNTKGEIKQAIEDKGVAVGNAPFDEYPNKIRQIQTGSGSAECVDGWRRPCCWAPFPQKDENTDYFMGLVAVEDTNNEVVSLKWEAGTSVIGAEKIVVEGTTVSYWNSPTDIWGSFLGHTITKNSTSLFAATSQGVYEFSLATGEFIRRIYDEATSFSGTSLAADDNTLVIGLRFDYGDTQARNSGIVVIINLADGSRQTLQNPSITTADDMFGTSVAINSDYVFVSASQEDSGYTNNTGCVYMYSRIDYSIVHTFEPTAGLEYQQLGTKVAVAGDTLLITAEGANGWNGAAYVYNLQNYAAPPIELLNPNTNASIAYVATIHGNYIMIGASSDPGAVYLYNATTGALLTTIYALAANSKFGSSIAATDDIIAITAPYEYINENWGVGSVYLFDYTGAQVGRLELPSDLMQPGINFGDGGVLISGNYVYVGSTHVADYGRSGSEGSVLRYQLSSRTLDSFLMTPADRVINIASPEYIELFDVEITSVTDEQDNIITDYTFVNGNVVIPAAIAAQYTIRVGIRGTDSYSQSYSGENGAGSTLVISADNIEDVMVLHSTNNQPAVLITDYVRNGNNITLGATVPPTSYNNQYFIFCSRYPEIVTHTPVTIDWGDGVVEQYPKSDPTRISFVEHVSIWDFHGETTFYVSDVAQWAGVAFGSVDAFRYLNIQIHNVSIDGTPVSFTFTGDELTLADPIPVGTYEMQVLMSAYEFGILELSTSTTGEMKNYVATREPLVFRDNQDRDLVPSTEWTIDGTTFTLNAPYSPPPTIVLFTSMTGSASHVYNYNNPSLVSNLSGQCTLYKQSIVTLTPVSGKLRTIDLSIESQGRGEGSVTDRPSAWLDIEINGSEIKNVYFFPSDNGGSQEN